MVVTCFFIDTATNILSYIETIHKILKEGGTWINIGMCFMMEIVIEQRETNVIMYRTSLVPF